MHTIQTLSQFEYQDHEQCFADTTLNDSKDYSIKMSPNTKGDSKQGPSSLQGSNYNIDEEMMHDVSLTFEDNCHSLPTPEELYKGKVTNDELTEQEGAKKLSWWSPWTLVLFGSTLVFVLGLSLGLAAKNARKNAAAAAADASSTSSGWNPQITNESISEGTVEIAFTVDDVVKYLVSQGVSSEADLMTPGSPQRKAAVWLADTDTLKLAPPVDSLGIATPDGYSYISRYVLGLLFYKMGGNAWSSSMEFLGGRDHCFWSEPRVSDEHGAEDTMPGGVYCNSAHEVISIFLGSNSLQGELPSEIGMLSSLLVLDANFNKIVGQVPESICNLSNLRFLGLGYNQMEGVVPSCISSLTDMHTLFLSNNRFSGELPADIKKLTNMETLKVDDNDLSGDITGMFDGMTNLQFLYIQNNQFTGTIDGQFLFNGMKIRGVDISSNFLKGSFPDHLFWMPQLEVLNLHKNSLDGAIATGFPSHAGFTSKLKHLSLYENQFIGRIPVSLGGLKQLELFDASNNAFTGPLPEHLGDLVQLKTLFLAGNNFDAGAIPTNFGNLESLEELSLKSTGRSGSIPWFIGRNMSKLALLDLDDNDLTGAIPGNIGDLSDLQFLLVNRNIGLNGNLPQTVSQLSSLRLAFFDRTSLTGGFDTLCSLPNLNEPQMDADGMEMVTADCGGTTPKVQCECCDKCCQDGEICHSNDEVAHLNAQWETSFNRFQFLFGPDGDVSFRDMYYVNNEQP